jgi:hypothetical protein
VSGTVQDEQIVTISGSNFGTKTAAKPWRWDTFEGKTLSTTVGAISAGGANLSRDSVAWDVGSNGSGGTRNPFYDNVQLKPNSTVSVYHQYYPAGRSNWGSWYAWAFSSPFPHLVYMSYWHYYSDFVEVGVNNWKHYRHYGSYPIEADQGLPQITWTTGNGWGGDQCTMISWEAGNPFVTYGYSGQAHPMGRWVRSEYINYMGTAGNTDAWWKANFHLNPGVSAITLIVGPSPTGQVINDNAIGWRDIMPEEYMTTAFQAKVWTDDIYIDDTQARVELGDKSTWSACTWRDIQPATSWSDNSIQISVNQGRFGSSANAYLYIVDSTGVVNANGYPVSIGSGSSDTTAPAAPTGVSVS